MKRFHLLPILPISMPTGGISAFIFFGGMFLSLTSTIRAQDAGDEKPAVAKAKTSDGEGEEKAKVLPLPPMPGQKSDLDFQSLARLPYQQLMKIARSDVLQKRDSPYYKLKIQSLIDSVKPEDIELFLDVPDKPIILIVDNDGFVNVPNSNDLEEQNPDLVANQPRGTVSISVQMEVPKVDPPKIKDGKVSYQELFRPLVEIEDQMKKVDPTFGLNGRQQFVLEIETGKTPIKITRAFGSRTYSPNSKGKVYMVKETYLYEENPEVEIPNDAKMNVIPASPDEVTDIRSRN